MRKCKIDKALDKLNNLRGVAYPDIGYTYYANIAGDGRKHRSVYTITTAGGGVTHSPFNDKTPAKTLTNIYYAILKG